MKLASGSSAWNQIPDRASAVCATTHTNSYCLGINCSLLRYLGLSGHKWKESKVCPVVRDCAGHLAKTETGWTQPGESARWHREYGVSSKNKATANRCIDLGCTLQPWKRWLQPAHRCNERPAAQRLLVRFFHTAFGHYKCGNLKSATYQALWSVLPS